MKKLLSILSASALLTIPTVMLASNDVDAQMLGSDMAFDAPDEGGDGFPVSFNTGLSMGMGNGILQAGTFQVPDFGTSIPLSMSWRLPEVEFLPRLSLSAGTGLSVSWLSTAYSGSGGAGDRIPRIGDLTLGLSFGPLMKDPIIAGQDWSKLNISGRTSARLPMSIGSRTSNMRISGGLGLSFGWSTMQLEFWPKFIPLNFFYSPNVSATDYSETSGSIPCDVPPDFSPGQFGTGDPAIDTVGIPLRIPRAKEILPNGECRLIGRQALASLNHTVGVGTGFLNHSLSVSFGYGMAFFRPLGGGDGFSSPFASKQNFSDFTTGSVSYGYDIPDEALGLDAWGLNTNLGISLSSGQPAYTFDGRDLRFPWWDFISPNNNFSSLSLSFGASFN